MVSLFLNTNIFDEIYYLHFLSVPLNTVPKIIQKFLSIFVINFHSITLNFTCLLLKKECSDPTPSSPSTNNLAMVKNITLCSNLSITVIKQNFWKKGHPVAMYPYESNLQYD